jgi:NhaA family Na+:H+ antiporter
MQAILKIFKHEAAGGMLLVSATFIALVLANSPLEPIYDQVFNLEMELRLENFSINKPLILWINDGLMAVFFFLIGLELKREILEGNLSNPRNVVTPLIAAVGGMAVPALVYIYFNYNDPVGIQGWAIPTATDIAFALAVLTILGKQVPVSLKVFLTTLAIADDLGAIIVIAIFYTAEIAQEALIAAVSMIAGMIILKIRKVDSIPPYLFLGIILWVSVLKSGIHATLAGVIIALFIPLYDKQNRSPLKDLEHELHPSVALFILPLFALANCGLNLGNVTFSTLTAPVPMGAALGLLIGKPLGVMLFTAIAVFFGLGKLPEKTNWLMMLGVSFLTGIGFTMSLFIGSLAFDDGGLPYQLDERLGILLGSALSGLMGFFILKLSIRRL